MPESTFKLAMNSGPTPGKEFPLEKNEVFIGRDLTNDVVINDAEVSRRHARLVAQAGGYILEDLGSTNGTFVNGQRLMGPYILRAGETVTLGEHVSLVFQEERVDPDATVVSASLTPTVGQPEQPPSHPQQIPEYPPAQQMPPSPVQQFPPVPEPVIPHIEPQPPVYNQTPAAPPQPVYSQTPAAPPPPPPSYSGQMPQGPAIAVEPPKPAKKRGMSIWVIILILVILIVLCACVVGGYQYFSYIDKNSLWCTRFPFIPGCPGG